MSRCCGSLLVLALITNGLGAAEPAPVEKTGLAVGERAPQFTLRDQQGQPRSLASLCEKGPVALVFFRSASW